MRLSQSPNRGSAPKGGNGCGMCKVAQRSLNPLTGEAPRRARQALVKAPTDPLASQSPNRGSAPKGETLCAIRETLIWLGSQSPNRGSAPKGTRSPWPPWKCTALSLNPLTGEAPRRARGAVLGRGPHLLRRLNPLTGEAPRRATETVDRLDAIGEEVSIP